MNRNGGPASSGMVARLDRNTHLLPLMRFFGSLVIIATPISKNFSYPFKHGPRACLDKCTNNYWLHDLSRLKNEHPSPKV
jgi:hypothetical protein